MIADQGILTEKLTDFGKRPLTKSVRESESGVGGLEFGVGSLELAVWSLESGVLCVFVDVLLYCRVSTSI